MRVELMDVTPEVANTWLANNGHNRSLTANRVRSLAAAMRSGKWAMNGETVIISETGKLLDGQHRLKAVTEFGRPVQMLVAFGASDASFETIDTGKARSPGDILSMSQVSNPTAVAASAKLIWQMHHGLSLLTACPPVYLLKVAERYPAIQYWAKKTAGMGAATITSQSVLIACLAYFENIAKKPALAQKFFDDLTEGADLSDGSPVLALRNRLIRLRISGGKVETKWSLPITIKAISSFEAGRKAERFKIIQSTGAAERPDMWDAHIRALTPEERLSDLLPPERVKAA